MATESLKGKVRKAVEWLAGRSKDAASGKAIYHTRPTVGHLYLFNYSAKHKETLPYWDRHPLMMPIGYYPDGILGLNFHYLPPAARAKLFETLKNYTSGQDVRKRIEISYQMLNRVAKHRVFKPCVKRYLYPYVQSKFALVPPSEWDLAIMLPTQKFVKASSGTVWRESMRK